MRRSLVILTLFACTTQAAPANGPSLGTTLGTEGELAFRTERIIAFKDGYALSVKRGKAKADSAGRVYTHAVPGNAILGGFWASALTRGAQIEAMRAEEIERAKPGVCASMTTLIEANTGKRVTLEMSDGKSIEGTISARIGEMVAIQQGAPGKGVEQVVFLSAVRSLTGGITHECAGKPEKDKVLTFELGKKMANREVEIRMFYFAPGVRWIPTYRVNMETDDRARVELSGEIINELEDIDGPIDLVVGVPHFKFKGVPSPLALERVLRNALNEAAPQLMNQNMSNGFFNSRAGEVYSPADVPTVGSDDPSLRTAESHELFVYTVPHLRLPKGARAQVPLFVQKSSVKHVYTVEMNAPVDVSSGVNKNQVWYNIELENPGKTPWTTGAALVMKGMLPLGQDLLTYTQKNGKVLLPVSPAVGVRAELVEEELSRTEDARRINNYKYSRLKRRVTLTLRNNKGERVEVRARVGAPGAVTSTAKVQYLRGDAVNKRALVTETYTIKPGAEKKLVFVYDHYVR